MKDPKTMSKEDKFRFQMAITLARLTALGQAAKKATSAFKDLHTALWVANNPYDADESED